MNKIISMDIKRFMKLLLVIFHITIVHAYGYFANILLVAGKLDDLLLKNFGDIHPETSYAGLVLSERTGGILGGADYLQVFGHYLFYLDSQLYVLVEHVFCRGDHPVIYRPAYGTVYNKPLQGGAFNVIPLYAVHYPVEIDVVNYLYINISPEL